MATTLRLPMLNELIITAFTTCLLLSFASLTFIFKKTSAFLRSSASSAVKAAVRLPGYFSVFKYSTTSLISRRVNTLPIGGIADGPFVRFVISVFMIFRGSGVPTSIVM